VIVDEDAQELAWPVAVWMGVVDAIDEVLVEYLFFAAVDAFTVRDRAAPQLRSGLIEEDGRTVGFFRRDRPQRLQSLIQTGAVIGLQRRLR